MNALEKAGSTEAVAPGMVVKREGTCGHTQVSGWTARWGTRRFPRTEHGEELGGTGSMFPTGRAIHFQEESAQPGCEHTLGHHLNVRNWELGQADARFRDLWS